MKQTGMPRETGSRMNNLPVKYIQDHMAAMVILLLLLLLLVECLLLL